MNRLEWKKSHKKIGYLKRKRLKANLSKGEPIRKYHNPRIRRETL